MSDDPVILMVDDNRGDCDLMAIILPDAGVKATLRTAIDGLAGKDALQRMLDGKEPKCRLLLLDLNMPKVDGRELLAWTRNQPAFRNLPIVVLTSSHVDRDRDECLERGATDYLVKPVELSDLILLVQSLGKYLGA